MSKNILKTFKLLGGVLAQGEYTDRRQSDGYIDSCGAHHRGVSGFVCVFSLGKQTRSNIESLEGPGYFSAVRLAEKGHKSPKARKHSVVKC